jgi:hypothetical protein
MEWKDWAIILLVILCIFFFIGWFFGDIIPEIPGVWP